MIADFEVQCARAVDRLWRFNWHVTADFVVDRPATLVSATRVADRRKSYCEFVGDHILTVTRQVTKPSRSVSFNHNLGPCLICSRHFVDRSGGYRTDDSVPDFNLDGSRIC